MRYTKAQTMTAHAPNNVHKALLDLVMRSPLPRYLARSLQVIQHPHPFEALPLPRPPNRHALYLSGTPASAAIAAVLPASTVSEAP